MERRDLLKDEIEQLGKVLAQILSTFLSLKSKGNIAQAMETSSLQLKSELDLDMEHILSLSKEELTDYFKNRKLTAEHIESLADLLQERGAIEPQEELVQLYFQKTIELLNIADEVSNTLSFDRMNKRNEISRLLE